MAEFKAAVWPGGSMARKRTVVADLVDLTLDQSGRRPELWVTGNDPITFLKTGSSSVGHLLSRSSPHLRARFEDRFGTYPSLASDVPYRACVTRANTGHHRNSSASPLCAGHF